MHKQLLTLICPTQEQVRRMSDDALRTEVLFHEDKTVVR